MVQFLWLNIPGSRQRQSRKSQLDASHGGPGHVKTLVSELDELDELDWNSSDLKFKDHFPSPNHSNVAYRVIEE